GTGTYSIKPSGLTSVNYAITFVDGTLTVTPAPLTITANDASKAYGSANPAFTASYIGFVNGDTESSLTGSLGFTTTATAASVVGSYPITPSGLTSDNYSISYVDGTLTVTAIPTTGGGGNSGGSTVTSQPANNTTGSATVTPAAGGTVGLSNDVSLNIPANALQGNNSAQVAVQKVDTPPPAPSGFIIMGTVYQFTVNDQDHYSFSQPVTLTFTFDPSSLASGETPAVHYYDEDKGQWVNIGGTVSGNTITVTVDHFTEFAVMAAEKGAKPQEQEPSAPLTDIAGHWAQTSIEDLVSLGAISGYPDSTFKPDNTITRAEFATVLVKAFQLAPKEGRVFADTANSWAKDYISTAAAYNIVSGYSDSHFGLDDPVTREQMASMVVKASKLSPVNEETSFTDSADISAWAKEAVATVVKGGIMKGNPDNSFRPGAYATRAEAASVIVNALNKQVLQLRMQEGGISPLLLSAL
ncbi:MAG TPA: hypothetical protein DEF36_03880, partial [Desulfotomaculum sp.]|nr:hypothetical protein [Desulfotomaculum sp.]